MDHVEADFARLEEVGLILGKGQRSGNHVDQRVTFEAPVVAESGASRVPNGKYGDNPLSDMMIHGAHPFPRDVEEMLRRIDALGRRADRWPLGENWPYSPRELDWARGNDLDAARQLLRHLIAILEAGRGDEVLVDPQTGKPIGAP